MRTVTKLRKQLDRALRTSYETEVQTAGAYVAIIFAALEKADRLRLVIQMFNDHNFGLEAPLSNTTPPPYELVDDETIETIDARLKDAVIELAKALSAYDRTVDDAASMLLDHLDALPDNIQRMVALARFLHAGLLPYVQIPAALLPEGEAGEVIARINAASDREQLRRSCILISQLIGHTKFPHPALVASAVAKLIRRYRDPDHVAVLLGHYTSVMLRRGTQSGMNLLGALAGVVDDDDDADEEELKEVTDEDLARHIATCGGSNCKYQVEYDRRQREKKRAQA